MRLGNNLYRKLGTVFMAISGLIYSFERITARISSSIIEAGHASNGHNIEIKPDYPGFLIIFLFGFFYLLDSSYSHTDSLRSQWEINLH